jgi:hypothetical protein
MIVSSCFLQGRGIGDGADADTAQPRNRSASYIPSVSVPTAVRLTCSASSDAFHESVSANMACVCATEYPPVMTAASVAESGSLGLKPRP